MTTKKTAQQTCTEQTAAIMALLEEIRAKVDHYNGTIESPHWGNAGDLGYVRDELEAVKKAVAGW
jgi:hypothetical protein